MASRRGAADRRSNRRRTLKEQGGGVLRGYKQCPQCGKWCYSTRADARGAARLLHPGSTVRYYICEPPGERWWHFTSMTAGQEAAIREQKAQERQPD